jgi:hypothetical protein
METVTEHQAAEQEQSSKIQRYKANLPYPGIEAASDGEFVRYEDHVAAMLNPMGHQLTRDDKATNKLLQHIINNIANEEQSTDFAGFQFHRATNDEGELLFMALVPCDNIAGITAPRFSFEAAKAPAIKAATAAQLKLVKP